MTGEPAPDCGICQRLAGLRKSNAIAWPAWYNAPVPSFGDPQARLLVVGLAPGLHGANRTGRPFTGDAAGVLLYATLAAHGFTRGEYRADPADGLILRDCMITNAVRCLPPENKPSTTEIANCRQFLAARIAAMPNLRAILALGKIAHDSVTAALGLRPSAAKFAHGARFKPQPGLALYDSYHCSRYNTNTRRLTAEMFEQVFLDIKSELSQS